MSEEAVDVIAELPKLPKGVAYKGFPCVSIYDVRGNIALSPMFVDPPVKKKSDFPLNHYLLKKSDTQLLCWSRLAEVVLPIPATSGDVERVFSRSGIICTPRRNRLKPDTIKKLVFLHQAYLEAELFNARQRKTIKYFDHFISLMIKYLNDEAAWNEYFFSLADDLEPVYFSDDDGDEDEFDDGSGTSIIEGLASHEE